MELCANRDFFTEAECDLISVDTVALVVKDVVDTMNVWIFN